LISRQSQAAACNAPFSAAFFRFGRKTPNSIAVSKRRGGFFKYPEASNQPSVAR
jgi:hypothetical protein